MVDYTDEAIRLAALGLRMHPLVPGNKVPIVRSWQEKATVETAKLKAWGKINAGCNWGLATGVGSNVFVVDIDVQHNGDKTWEKLIHEYSRTPKTPEVKTGSGGRHIYFTYPINLNLRNSSGKLGEGIDIRAEGGQVVVPPSIHPNGTAYTWVEGLEPWNVPFAKAPKWLLNLLEEAADAEISPAIGEDLDAGTKNNAIYHQALVLARQGALKEITLLAMIEWVKQQREDVPDDEIEQTVNSAYKKAGKEKAKKDSSGHTPRTDDDNAQLLISTYGKDLLYVVGPGWFTWNGKYWVPDTDEARVTALAITCMRNLRDEALEEAKDPSNFKIAIAKANWATGSLNLGRLRSMIELASKDLTIRKNPNDLNPVKSKFLLNFYNGTLNLKTGELYQHTREDLLTTCMVHNYIPDAVCPTWEETLSLAFDGNQDLMQFTKRALGYSISGSTAEQCLFICYGETGNNGKSTILETMQDILGSGYAQMSDMKVVTSAEMDNRVASSMAKLQGARLVSMNEAEENQKLSEALVKQLTGGDTVQACFKFKEPFEYKPVFKLWIRTNEKPVIRGMTDAIWRRIKLIPFDKPIPPEKRKSRDVVDDALRNEAEGILAWLVAGFSEWSKTGLQDPPEVQAATLGYRTEMDIIASFFDENVEEDETARVPRSDLYQAFVRWSKDNGYRYIMSADAFGKRVGRRLDKPDAVVKINGKRGWAGIKLSESAELMMLGG